MENFIRINRQIPALLLSDSALTKSMSVFYAMKFLYVGGIIKDIPSRYGEISSKIGISSTNLRSKLKSLYQKKLVRKEGRNLVFAGYEEINRIFKTKTKKSFKVSHCDAKKLETILKALALETNLETQRHAINEKIIKEELKRYGNIQAKSIRNKIRRYIRKNISHYAEKNSKRVSKSPKKPFVEPKINSVASLSRLKIAEKAGRVSKSSGSRLVKKMKGFGLILEDSKRIEAVCGNANRSAMKALDLDSSYFLFKGTIYKRKSNILSFANFFA